MQLVTRSRTLVFPRAPLVMGIVNLSADSFSGDGCPSVADAISHAERLIGDGAEIIDLGAESAGTQREAIGEQEEADRLCAFISKWNDTADQRPAPALLSVNTWRPAVARAALSIGGDILNDIGGLPDGENAVTCRDTGAALLIMHTVGVPKVRHTHVRYVEVMETLDAFFTGKLQLAEQAGLGRDRVILDPGIDFAKQRPDNLRILRELGRLQKFGRPILLPISRKTVIGEVLELPPAERDAGTVACAVSGLLRGAQIFRVHNVRAAVQAIRIVQAVESAATG